MIGPSSPYRSSELEQIQQPVSPGLCRSRFDSDAKGPRSMMSGQNFPAESFIHPYRYRYLHSPAGT